MEKIEIIYNVYCFGFKNVIVSYNPFIFQPRGMLAIPPTFEDFKRNFADLLVKHNMTEDMFYDKLRPAIHFLITMNLI